MGREETIVHIGPVELYASDAEKLCADGKYIVTYSRIYQLFPPTAGYPYVKGQEIYYSRGLAKRGRFHALTAADVNRLVGSPLVRE